MSAGAHGVTVDEERTSQQYAGEFPGVSLADGGEGVGEGVRVVRLLGGAAAAFAAAQ